MRCLFVTEPFLYEHLGIMYLSAILKKAGHITKIHKTNEPIDNVINFKPDFIMYSLMTGSHKNLLDYNMGLKKKLEFTSIFGGPHCTYFPDIIKKKGVDYVVRGEAEKAILKVIEKPEKKIILGELIEDLNDVPFPDRDLIYEDPKQKNNPIKHFVASRGCPFNCPYCYNHIWCQIYENGKRVRQRSVENVIQEIKEVTEKYPTKLIYFQDDCFIINKKWAYEFLDAYKKNFKLPFHCIVRLNLVDDEMARKLKEAGCMCVRCAAESGNDYLRNKVLKRNMSKAQIYGGTGLLRKYGIKFVLQNILALPESNLKRDLETLRVNMKCKPTLGWCSLFQPYPMTELGKPYDIDVDKFKPNFYDDTLLDLPHKEEVKRLQKLFGVTVRYPIIYPFIRLLIKLPLDKHYKKIWKWNNDKSDKALYGGII